MKLAELDSEVFRNPGTAYRAVTLWMLNDRLEPDELRRQLRGFKDAGWGAVITRTFNGLRTEYLSEEWMEALEVVVETARELDMKVWFQAGYMPNAFPDLPQELQHEVLVAQSRGEEPTDGTVVAEDGESLYVARRLENAVDLLNPEAVRRYLELAYEETWFARFGDAFGETIEAVWVDEPCLRFGKFPWGDRVIEAVRQEWGISLPDRVPELFRRTGDWRALRHRFWRTVLSLFDDGYFRVVREWCERHGVLFAGHLMGEDNLRQQVGFNAAAMPHYAHMGVPGIDHLTADLRWPYNRDEERSEPCFVITPKQCSSAADQTGEARVLAEMYGVSSHGLTFEDRKRIGEWHALLGINQRCLHGSFYSMRGRRKRIYPVHLSYQQPWWRENRTVSDYFARLSYALREARCAADVLVLHPIESAFCYYTQFEHAAWEGMPERTELEDLQDSLMELSLNLLKAHRGFHYGDEAMLAAGGRVADGSLELGDCRYGVIILPSILTLRDSTVDLLRDFLDAGGTVLRAGEAPELTDLMDRIPPVANEPGALASAVSQAVPPRLELEAVEGPGERIYVYEGEVERGRLFFLLNTDEERRVEVEARFPGGGRPERWDLETGEISSLPQGRADGGTVCPLAFEPWQSHLVLLREGQLEVEARPAPTEVVREIALTGDWHVERGDPNALTLDFCRLRREDGDYGEVIPVSAVQQILQEDDPYSGPIGLRFEFGVEEPPSHVALVVEDPSEWTMTVNGREVRYSGIQWWIDRSFRPTDITEVVREGLNVIELEGKFEPLRRASGLARLFTVVKGTEVESAYLIGDFGVYGTLSEGTPQPPCRRFEPGFVIGAESPAPGGDLVGGGYPFYAGEITLSHSFDLDGPPAEGTRAYLSLTRLDACVARARVNGAEAGRVAWKPYRLDITEHLREGRNTVQIVLVSTLRNLLGPHHRPRGELLHCWGEDAFMGRWDRDSGEGYERWYERRGQETKAWTDDYFFMPFGLEKGARIEFVRERP